MAHQCAGNGCKTHSLAKCALRILYADVKVTRVLQLIAFIADHLYVFRVFYRTVVVRKSDCFMLESHTLRIVHVGITGNSSIGVGTTR